MATVSELEEQLETDKASIETKRTELVTAIGIMVVTEVALLAARQAEWEASLEE